MRTFKIFMGGAFFGMWAVATDFSQIPLAAYYAAGICAMVVLGFYQLVKDERRAK